MNKSNEQLKQAVLDELAWEPTLKSSDIEVFSHNGTITLRGTVRYYAEKFTAERAVQRVEGVKAIAENLQVNPSGVQKLTDTEIAESVVSSLKWHVWVPSDIFATVEDGWVTLTGSVHWGFQRQSAEDSIRHLIGVKGITNSITLIPEVEAQEVSKSIADSLNRNSEIDASRIQVTSDGGKVTLGGSVHSWDERREAFTVAWNAPGVTYVQNNIAVAIDA